MAFPRGPRATTRPDHFANVISVMTRCGVDLKSLDVVGGELLPERYRHKETGNVVLAFYAEKTGAYRLRLPAGFEEHAGANLHPDCYFWAPADTTALAHSGVTMVHGAYFREMHERVDGAPHFEPGAPSPRSIALGDGVAQVER
jgi:hypothetical protein